MINVGQTIISQYANSPTITALIEGANQNIDPIDNIAVGEAAFGFSSDSAPFDVGPFGGDWEGNSFYDFVWNVDTAQGFGLDIWGRIVSVGRYLEIGGGEIVRLDDTEYRKLILVKALANIAAVNSPTLNSLLRRLFDGRGIVFVSDLGGMQIRYTLLFEITPIEKAIITNSGVMPRPAGVEAKVFAASMPRFGFRGSGLTGFNQAPFLSKRNSHAVK